MFLSGIFCDRKKGAAAAAEESDEEDEDEIDFDDDDFEGNVPIHLPKKFAPCNSWIDE